MESRFLALLTIGVLGTNGCTEPSETAVPILIDAGPDVAPPSAKIVDISAGAFLACALHRSGEVWCWGSNNRGQLGIAPTTETCESADGPEPCQATPRKVEGVADAVRVSAGRRSACAVTREGSVFCWGSNEEFQLGTRAAPHCNGACSYVPIRQNLEPTEDVVVGDQFACALTRTKRVLCWGKSVGGLLGFDAGASRTEHAASPQLPDAPVDTLTASSTSNACARLQQGKVYCWGEYAQVGADAGTDPTEISGVSNPLSLSIGERTGIASTAEGLVAWGQNTHGLRGSPPASVHADPEWVFDSVSLRNTHALGLRGGIVSAWGDGTWSALGAVSATATCHLCRAVPTPVPGLPADIVRVSAGTHVSLALSRTGKVYAWGRNGAGQLGHAPGTAGDAECPTGQSWCNRNPLEVTIGEP